MVLYSTTLPRRKKCRTMAANINIQAGSGRYATKYIGPPKDGYAARYEQLLVEELSLENSRKKYLKSSSASADPTCNDEQQLSSLTIRGMIHRASLEGMLLAAQYAADEVKSSLSDEISIEYERGLEQPEAKDALAALWTMKSRQLENDDNQLPLPLGSEVLAWRRKFLEGMLESMDANYCVNGSLMLEANVDDFFYSFGEFRRRDCASNDSDVDDSSESDGYGENDNRRSRSKRKKMKELMVSNEEPIIVTCASSSPSPDRPNQIMAVESSVNVTNPSSRDNVQKHNPTPPISFDQLRTVRAQCPRGRNSHESGIAIATAPQSAQRPSSSDGRTNPYQKRQQTQVKNDKSQHQNGYQNETVALFDYDDNNSHHETEIAFESLAKKNPFCTARELGPKFNDKSRGGNMNGDLGSNNWDYSGRNDYGYPDNNHQRRTDGGVGSNNRSLSSSTGPYGPQQMVRTAIRGPRKDISAGLQRKFQLPMKRENSGVNDGQASGNANNTSSNSNSTSRQAYGGGNGGSGKDDDELPEELRGLDKELIEKINNEIVDSGEQVTFDDIAGLKHAKETVNELVIMPMIRPDLFTGLRACPKGLLLFGPPGTGECNVSIDTFPLISWSLTFYSAKTQVKL